MKRFWWLVPLFSFCASTDPSSDPFSSAYPSDCAENERYTTCSSSSCFETVCGVVPTLLCTKDCKTGCQCKPGFARQGSICVALADCPDPSGIIWKRGSASSLAGVLRLQSAGRCVSVPSLTAGEALFVHTCDKRTDLQLDLSGFGIRSAAQTNLCLAAPSEVVVAGQGLVLAECSEVDSQKLRFNSFDGTIRVQYFCLENKAVTGLALVPCTGASEQHWELTDNGCTPAPTAPLTDYGFEDEFRGWYDTQGCGTCRDFCRWVGNQSGGDPTLNQMVGTSHWSCSLAGSVREFTLPLYFQYWNFTKCSTLTPDEDIRRSVDITEDLAVAEMPIMPRSVPRRPRTSVPPSPGPATNPEATNSSTGLNGTWAADSNVTMMPQVRTNTQPVLEDSPSVNSWAIPVGVVCGIIFIAWVSCLCFRALVRKETQAPASVAPQTTVAAPQTTVAAPQTTVAAPQTTVVASAPPLEAIAHAPPRIVVIPVATDDPPPPYHSIDTADPTEHLVAKT